MTIIKEDATQHVQDLSLGILVQGAMILLNLVAKKFVGMGLSLYLSNVMIKI